HSGNKRTGHKLSSCSDVRRRRGGDWTLVVGRNSRLSCSAQDAQAGVHQKRGRQGDRACGVGVYTGCQQLVQAVFRHLWMNGAAPQSQRLCRTGSRGVSEGQSTPIQLV
ncbi:hypothetical protein D4764_01G0017900, partial [Takifugu flavidus]